MGADLIVRYLVVKQEISPEESKKRMLEALDKIKDVNVFSELYVECLDNALPDSIDEAKEFVREIINEAIDAIGTREVTSIRHKGETIYITGGMSFGDDPTDAYDSFNKFEYLPKVILDAGGME